MARSKLTPCSSAYALARSIAELRSDRAVDASASRYCIAARRRTASRSAFPLARGETGVVWGFRFRERGLGTGVRLVRNRPPIRLVCAFRPRSPFTLELNSDERVRAVVGERDLFDLND